MAPPPLKRFHLLCFYHTSKYIQNQSKSFNSNQKHSNSVKSMNDCVFAEGMVACKRIYKELERKYMSKITTFYREFFIILLLVVLFFGLFGTLNDRIIQLITDSANNELMATSFFYKILFFVQALGLLGFILIAYKNGLPLKRKVKRLPKKTINIIILISAALILIPYVLLLF